MLISLPEYKTAYLLWNSVRPIDMHTAFNRAIMDRPHVTNEGFEYRWSSCGAKQLKARVLPVGVCVCVAAECLLFRELEHMNIGI